MRRVFLGSLAVLGLAALVAGPSIASAQTASDSTNARINGLPPTSPATPPACDTPTGVFHTATGGAPVPPSNCAGGIPGGDPGLTTATGNATSGVSANASTHFDGDNTGGPIVAHAFGTYYRIFTFYGQLAPNVQAIVLTSQATADTHIEPSTAHGVNRTVAGDLAWYNYTSPDFTNPDDEDFKQSINGSNDPGFTLQVIIARSSLGSDMSLFYSVAASSDISVSNTEPIAFADISVFDPIVTFQDAGGNDLNSLLQAPGTPTNTCPVNTVCYQNAPAVAATPEPASVVLLGTGLAGVGAVVRRKRKQVAA